MCASLNCHNFVHMGPFCVHDMSKCSPLDALDDGVVCIHITVNIDALIIVAKLLCDINCWNLLFVNIMYASCEWCNFVLVDPMIMILIWICSSLHALYVGVFFIHFRVHIDILIPVAKVHVAVNYWKLMKLAYLSFLYIFVWFSFEHHIYMF